MLPIYARLANRNPDSDRGRTAWSCRYLVISMDKIAAAASVSKQTVYK
jgi:hypothetical protein